MDTAGYISLNRQNGLLNEMSIIANNLANMSTTGYRAERVLFSEHVSSRGAGSASISMANANVRSLDRSQGSLLQTGGTLDVAIEGEGFFRVTGSDGDYLTRAGSFHTSTEGQLVDQLGGFVLDQGGAEILLPTGVGKVTIAADGTISADGQVVSRIGLWKEGDASSLERRDGVRFQTAGTIVALEGTVLQGFVERSNVAPVREIARMIEVQRAYELGQSLIDREDERIRNTIRDVGK